MVVIRGTNPVSALDWLFGDFCAGRQLRWAYGADTPADAKISFSTALGLDVLRHMRSSGTPGGIAGDLWRFIDEDVGGQLRKAGDYLLRPLKDTVETLITGLRKDIRGLLDEVTQHERSLAKLMKPDLEARVKTLLAARKSDPKRRLLDLVDKAAHTAGDPIALDLLRVLEGDSWIRTQFGRGQDVLSFLKAAVAHAKGPIDVTVTGHSKGGALAPTVALWLADTQGTAGVPAAAQWDPHGNSIVRCFSFAGQPAGNPAFAKHSDAKLRGRCARIWNTHDVVPHAWVADDIRQIPDLYGNDVHRIHGFTELAEAICHDLQNVGIE